MCLGVVALGGSAESGSAKQYVQRDGRGDVLKVVSVQKRLLVPFNCVVRENTSVIALEDVVQLVLTLGGVGEVVGDHPVIQHHPQTSLLPQFLRRVQK